MARTAIREGRREAFLDAAQRLIVAKGYEQMSVQDLLDTLELSKGAFYHYFDSKADLLEAVVERMVDVGLDAVRPMLADADLSAAEKMRRLFGGIQRWKTERKDLMLAVLRVWYSDDNALLRDKLRRAGQVRLVPMLAEIIRQGRAEGAFSVESPAAAAAVLVWLLQGLQDMACDLFFARERGEIGFAEVESAFGRYQDYYERVLGAAPGTLSLLDPAVLREWYG